MELGFIIVKSAPVWAGFSALGSRGLVQKQIIERVVYNNTLSIKWFSYCSKLHSSSYIDSLVFKIHLDKRKPKIPMLRSTLYFRPHTFHLL